MNGGVFAAKHTLADETPRLYHRAQADKWQRVWKTKNHRFALAGSVMRGKMVEGRSNMEKMSEGCG